VQRELGTYLMTRTGYIIGALMLALDGLLFNVFAVSTGSRYSSEVLSDFFFYTSGPLMGAAVFLSMRLIAEERQSGTLPLLLSSSLSEGEIVFAKFLSAFSFLSILTLITFYMPALIFIHGHITIGQIMSGYIGLLLLGAASVAIGTFGSAIGRSQVMAVVISGSIVVFLVILWWFARLVDGALGDVVNYMALHNIHFRPFMDGTLALKDVVFYVSTTILFLVLARNSLEARRWG
jgi:ABC-2 type transport system permease protein